VLYTHFTHSESSSMAWLQKRGGMWWIGWRHSGQQFRKSLKTSDESEAKRELQKLHSISATKALNALTSDYITAITGQPPGVRPHARQYFTEWLKEAKATIARSTYTKYQQVVREFSAFIEADSTNP